MEFFKKETKINFMGLRKITGSFSLLLCLASIVIICFNGFNFGLEFTGGTQVELKFNNEVELETIKAELLSSGIAESRVQYFGTTKDVLIRFPSIDAADEKFVAESIKKIFASHELEIRKVEYVGSEVGHQLAEQGGVAVLAAILATMVYIALRFEYRLAISTALGLCHNVIIVLGILSLLHVEFNLATLAAILAVLGYSLNDTIVIFDRVRENFRKTRVGDSTDIMNLSINQTLSRTLITSSSTLFVVLALLINGGDSLFGFSLAFALGVVIGTYSSIYIAGVFALALGLSRADLLPKAKVVVDDLP